MSCKVIRCGARDLVIPSFFTGPDGPPSRTSPAQAPVETLTTELDARIAELERALQRDVQQAREAGFRDGEKAGREKAAAELQPVLERLTRTLHDVVGVRARVRREAETDLVTLAMAIARRILRREVSVDPDAIQGLIKAAMEKIQCREGCRVRVHAGHVAFVRKQLDAMGTAAADVVADAGLQPGDVIIETNRGDVDASIDRQLQEIERGFADRLGGQAKS